MKKGEKYKVDMLTDHAKMCLDTWIKHDPNLIKK